MGDPHQSALDKICDWTSFVISNMEMRSLPKRARKLWSQLIMRRSSSACKSLSLIYTQLHEGVGRKVRTLEATTLGRGVHLQLFRDLHAACGGRSQDMRQLWRDMHRPCQARQRASVTGEHFCCRGTFLAPENSSPRNRDTAARRETHLLRKPNHFTFERRQ